MTPTIRTTQNVKEAAGMLEIYKSELNKFVLSLPENEREGAVATAIEAVMSLDIFGPADVQAALYVLQGFQTEGTLEDLRCATVRTLQGLSQPEPAQQLAS